MRAAICDPPYGVNRLANLGRESVLKRFLPPALLVVTACLMLAGTGCGDDAGSDATPTAGAGATVDVPVALPTGIIADGHVTSESVGYEATVPAGWNARFNIIMNTGVRGDGYFKPQEGTPDPARAQVNISAKCEERASLQPPVETVDEVLQQKVEVLQQLRREDIRSATHPPVDGREARQADYVFRLSTVVPTPVPPTPPAPESLIVIDGRDVFFLSDACLWTVSLIAPQGELEQEAETLEAFLASFHATR